MGESEKGNFQSGALAALNASVESNQEITKQNDIHGDKTHEKELVTRRSATKERKAKKRKLDKKQTSSAGPNDKKKNAESSKTEQIGRRKVATNEELNRTIFVGNFPLGVTRKAVKKIFSVCGAIDTVRLRSIIPKDEKMSKKVAAIKQEISTEAKDNVNVYVKFKDAMDVEKALKMNGHLFENHRLQVDTCAESVKYDCKRSVFVGNLSYTAKEDDLHGHFADCGEIERVRIVRDSETGFSKGFGFVIFKEAGCVDLALKLNGERFDKRPLRIRKLMKKVDRNDRYRTGTQGKADAKTGRRKKMKHSQSLMQ